VDSVLREIGDSHGGSALVLVHEVVGLRLRGTNRNVVHRGPEFVVTSSLDQVYGVSGLRCGWILAQPDLLGSAPL